ncbi:MAG: acyl carrier protein [Streptosporangiaceae bacterium]
MPGDGPRRHRRAARLGLPGRGAGRRSGGADAVPADPAQRAAADGAGRGRVPRRRRACRRAGGLRPAAVRAAATAARLGAAGATARRPGGGAVPGPAGPVTDTLRRLLVSITGRAELAGLPLDAPLLRDGADLDSLSGTLLLAEIRRRLGVDVAAEDLNLDCLATLRTLAEFVAARAAQPAQPGQPDQRARP